MNVAVLLISGGVLMLVSIFAAKSESDNGRDFGVFATGIYTGYLLVVLGAAVAAA